MKNSKILLNTKNLGTISVQSSFDLTAFSSHNQPFQPIPPLLPNNTFFLPWPTSSWQLFNCSIYLTTVITKLANLATVGPPAYSFPTTSPPICMK